MTNGNHQLASLSDLGEIRTDVKLMRPDGRVLTVPMRTLSEQEVWEVQNTVKMPEAPFTLGRFDGPDKPPRKQYDYENPQYRAAVDERNRRIMRLLMVRTLLIPIEGDTDDAKADTLLKTLGAWSERQLLTQMNILLGISDPEVVARADTFHTQGDSGTADMQRAGLDATDMAHDVTDG